MARAHKQLREDEEMELFFNSPDQEVMKDFGLTRDVETNIKLERARYVREIENANAIRAPPQLVVAEVTTAPAASVPPMDLDTDDEEEQMNAWLDAN